MNRKSILIPGLFALSLAAVPGCNLADLIGLEKATKTANFTIPIPDSGKCVIRTKNGRIRCVAAEVSEISIKAEITARAATVEDAENRLEQITVDHSESAGVLEIAANVPRGINGGVSITATLPSEMMLDLQTSNGAIEVTAVSGGVTGVTSNGAVRIVDCAGNIKLESSNGKMTIEGESLANVKAKTSNGSVRLDGSLSLGTHEIQTSNGSITVALTGTPVLVTAGTSNGKITANSHKIKKGEKKLLGAPEETELPSVGDAAQLSLSTSNGSITITHRDEQETEPTQT